MTLFSTITKDREYGFKSPEAQLRSAHFPEVFARRLKLDKVLEGHESCVNRLAWNTEGSRLASGSDDRRVLVWQYPDCDALPFALSTRHACNIFAVQFLPCTEDRLIVSGAMDNTVQLHHLDVDPTTAQKYSPKSSRRGSWSAQNWARRRRSSSPHEVVSVEPSTTVYTCHTSRVKDLDVEPMNPYNFWSAGEDGTVRQFDTRCRDGTEADQRNVLIGLRTETRTHIEAKGISINKVRPHQVAIACGDPYIRIFDRRKLSLGSAADVKSEPVLALAPPHLALSSGLPRYTTYIHFGNKGDKVVASYHGDHAYSFDVTGEGVMASAYIQPRSKIARTSDQPGTNVNTNRCKPASTSNADHPVHHPSAREYITQAHEAKEDRLAINCYDQALYYSPHSWDLYVERAKVLLKRDFAGDACFAVRDCDQAILLNDNFSDAHFFRLKALMAMGQLEAANSLMEGFLRKFPMANSWEHVQEFQKDLFNAIFEEEESNKKTEQRAKHQNAERRDETGEPSYEADENMASSSDSEPERTTTSICQEECKKLYLENGSINGNSSHGIWFGTSGGQRLLSRFIGHCNMHTDIKESTFVGQNDDLVACGSDDGNVFIYEAESGRAVQVLQATEDVTNCVQCHPSRTVLATSGIDSVINIWSPGEELPGVDDNLEKAIERNQERRKAGAQTLFSPLFNEQMQSQMQLILDNYELVQLLSGRREGQADSEDTGDEDASPASCRVS